MACGSGLVSSPGHEIAGVEAAVQGNDCITQSASFELADRGDVPPDPRLYRVWSQSRLGQQSGSSMRLLPGTASGAERRYFRPVGE